MTSSLSSLDVLVVDDNPHMRLILLTVLKGVGVRRVQECADGAEALEALRHFAADVAIIDDHMSPVDGVELTRLIRNAPDSPNRLLPIIMMSGYTERSLIIEARDAGINEFVAKPVTARAVLDRLNAIILKPRPFVRAPSYFGPDRRRRQDPAYDGPWRRADDASRAAAGAARRRPGAFAP